MRAKCAGCGKYRQTRGSRFCDECAYEIFVAEYPEWFREMRRYGWSVIEDENAYDRVALLCERRWQPAGRNHPSPLWDASTPSSTL